MDQPEQDVLGTDVVVIEKPRLFLGKDDHPAGPVCESFEHLGHASSGLRPTLTSGLLSDYVDYTEGDVIFPLSNY